MDDLLLTGRSRAPARPWLGMYTAETQGRLVVNELATGGPAERAGIAAGDLVVAVAGVRVGSLVELFRQIWRQGNAGAEIPLTLARDGAPLHLKVRSVDRYDLLRKPSLQ
jgi:S1-C subfamily serine protease